MDTMIDNIESKIENVGLQECSLKKKVILELSYFTRDIYQTWTVTSGSSYIEDLNFLGNKIV